MVKKSTFKSLFMAGAAVMMMSASANAEQTTVTLSAADAEIVQTLNDNDYTVDGYTVKLIGTVKIKGYTIQFSTTRAPGATNSSALIPADPPYIRLKGTNNALAPNYNTIIVTAPEGQKMTKVSFNAINTPNYNFCSTDDSPNLVVNDGGKTNFYWAAPEGSEGLNNLEMKLRVDASNVTTTFYLGTIDVTYEDIQDGIETVEAESEQAIYTLTGMRVNAPATALPAGLYIIGGKKTVIR